MKTLGGLGQLTNDNDQLCTQPTVCYPFRGHFIAAGLSHAKFKNENNRPVSGIKGYEMEHISLLFMQPKSLNITPSRVYM